MKLSEMFVVIIVLMWGIVVGIVSSWKWWNLIIQPLIFFIGLNIGKLSFPPKGSVK